MGYGRGRELLGLGRCLMNAEDVAALVGYQVAQLIPMVGMVKDDVVGYFSEGYLHAGPSVC